MLRYVIDGTARILWQEGGISGIDGEDGGCRGRMIYLCEEVLLIFVLVAQTQCPTISELVARAIKLRCHSEEIAVRFQAFQRSKCYTV